MNGRDRVPCDEGGQRAICIALSGSDASHSVAEWACQSLLRPDDKARPRAGVSRPPLIRRTIHYSNEKDEVHERRTRYACYAQ